MVQTILISEENTYIGKWFAPRKLPSSAPYQEVWCNGASRRSTTASVKSGIEALISRSLQAFCWMFFFFLFPPLLLFICPFWFSWFILMVYFCCIHLVGHVLRSLCNIVVDIHGNSKMVTQFFFPFPFFEPLHFSPFLLIPHIIVVF